jgi:hypothetical protein
MVPKVAAKGTSFKGAGLYYLHDKKARSSERVSFTHTENLPTDDPDRAIKIMAFTAMHQNEIKAANGGARTGRKLAYPVYTYSLSWAPDETPNQEEMIAAGRETLKALGLDDHEVLMIAHRDEPHPHLHLIVNRVHPETGKAASLSKDHLVLSRWAEAYEKEQGKIRCEERVINNEARRKGNFMRDRQSPSAAEFHRWRKEQTRRAQDRRQGAAQYLSSLHKRERQVLLDARARSIRAFRDEQRIRNRPYWADLYRRQKQEWRDLNRAQMTAATRLKYFLEHRGHDPRARTKTGIKKMVAEAAKAVFGQDNPHGALSRKHEAERLALARKLRSETREGIREIEKRHSPAISRLSARHADERRALQERHSQESQQRARHIASGQDREQFERDAGGDKLDDLYKRVRARAKKSRKKDEAERKRDRDGGRERDS